MKTRISSYSRFRLPWEDSENIREGGKDAIMVFQ